MEYKAMHDSEFDYIIVGSGAAGSLLANRLSADPQNRVALIEAGGSDRRFPTNIKTRLPVGNIFLIPHAKYNWRHILTGSDAVGNRTIGFPRGKLLGGCTSINGSVYIRGQREDYDGWAAGGNEGWSYKDVLPTFRSLENYARGETQWHGEGGELDVQKPREFNALSKAFVAAAIEAGHARNPDFAGPMQAGFGQYDVNQRRGVRLSSSRAFLHPAMRRSNLTILVNAMVRRIVLDGRRAVAVEVEQRGSTRTINARREIILSAGAVNSPQILMLSGIGPEADLKAHGIPIEVALEGVGANLQDHPTIHIAIENPSGESHALSPTALPRILASPFRYLLKGEGMLASNVAEAGGFVCTDRGNPRPDIQMTFLVGLKLNARTVPSRHGYMILIQLLRPKSVGSIRLASARFDDKPVISPNFFSHPDDLATLTRGFREARKIAAQCALAALSGREIEPGADIQSDEDIAAAIRKMVNTAYHPAGTCKIGPDSDPMAVVDERLCVRGIFGLRVADASVMPEITSGNTSAPTMMIGQKAADFILRDRATTNIAA